MAEERQRAQQHDQAARDMVAKARDISQQDPDTALALLRTFTPPHALVTGLIADLESRIAAREDKRKAEEGRARAERAAIEPVKVDAGELPPPAASESAPTSERLPAADWTSGPVQLSRRSLSRSNAMRICSSSLPLPFSWPSASPRC